jgi:hypothetical protein
MYASTASRALIVPSAIELASCLADSFRTSRPSTLEAAGAFVTGVALDIFPPPVAAGDGTSFGGANACATIGRMRLAAPHDTSIFVNGVERS